MSDQPKWSGKSRGGRFGNWWFLMLIRYCGLWPAYIWLVFVAAYFAVFARREARSSRQYLERILGPQPAWRWPRLVFRHFYSAGITLLDRVAVISGKANMKFEFTGEPDVLRVLAQEHGLILLGAHVGGWEMGGHLMARHGRPVNFVVLERDEQRIRALFDKALAAKSFRILTADTDPLRSVPILAALRRGELVALHGDRTFGSEATVRLPFLGAPATFPIGPYMLAAATGAPIIHGFAMREKLKHYKFVSFPVQQVPRERGPGQAAIYRQAAEQYVANLTTLLKKYPFQWYNFYPFWDEYPEKHQSSVS